MIAIDQPTAAYAAVRAVHFGACLLLAGAFLFDRLIIAPAGPAARQRVDARWIPAARVIVFACLLVIALSGIGWLVCVTMSFMELSAAEAMHMAPLRAVLDQSQFGTLWTWRAMIWLVASGASLMAMSARRGSRASSLTAWAALLASAALAGSLARAGHGGEGTRLHQLADASHLLLGAAWPVGLFPLIVLLVTLPRTDAMTLIPILDRFSMMSVATVVLIGVTGVINSLPLVGQWSNLLTTTYGCTLVVKVSLFGLMVLLGAVNMLRVRPRLARAIEAGAEPDAARALASLRMNVALEILLGVCVLTAAGLLGALPPATSSCCSVG